MTEIFSYTPPAFSVTDTRFTIDQIPESELIFELSDTYFRFAIKTISNHKFVWLEDFTLYQDIDVADFIMDILNNHHLLSARFWKNIKFICHSTIKTVIPSHLDDYQIDELWHSLYGEAMPNKLRLHQKIGENTLLFEVMSKPLIAIQSFYAEKNIVIKPIEAVVYPATRKTMLLFYRNGLQVFKGFEHFVSFAANDFESVKKVLDISETQKIEVLGEVTEYSNIFRTLKNSYPQLQLSPSKGSLVFSQYFQDIPKHRYFIIFNS